MINPAYPANIGSYAGEVIKSEKGHIVIKADADIGVRDLLQVFEQVSAKPTLLHVKAMKMQGKRYLVSRVVMSLLSIPINKLGQVQSSI